MEIEELRKLRPALERYVVQFDDCARTAPSRKHLRIYVNGQLGHLPRKSVEPIALDAGVPPRTLQEFLSIHRWDEELASRRLKEIVRKELRDENAIAVVDEVAFPKKGTKTPGVQRQYCGATGQVENCVVTVALGYVAGDDRALLDQDLYLPKSWAEDRKRCEEAEIPQSVRYRPKWQIALEELRRAKEEGVGFRWVVADEVYGGVPEFRRRVRDELGMHYVVEVPSTTTGWTKPPKFRGSAKPRSVAKLGKRRDEKWKRYQIKVTEKGPVVWDVREFTFYPQTAPEPGEPERLLVLQEVLTGTRKYFVSDAPAEVPLETLLHVAFARWHIERLFEDGKGEVGLDHFEVRNYTSLRRHLVLSRISLYFLLRETKRLRKKKPALDDMSDEGSCGGSARPSYVPAGAHAPPEESHDQDRLRTGPQRPNCLLPQPPAAAATSGNGCRPSESTACPASNIAL